LIRSDSDHPQEDEEWKYTPCRPCTLSLVTLGTSCTIRMEDVADEFHGGRGEWVVLVALVPKAEGSTFGNERVAGKIPPSKGVPSGPEI